MPVDKLLLPPAELLESHVLVSLERYWQNRADIISALPVRRFSGQLMPELPMRLADIRMPSWAGEWTVNGCLVIPEEIVPAGHASAEPDLWKKIDWFLAAFLMLEAWHERLHEAEHGPVHSYSFHLKNWDERLWKYAWVNRIALFLSIQTFSLLPGWDNHSYHIFYRV